MKNKVIPSLFGAALLTGCGLQAQSHPNVVLIFMDDMGYGDLTLTGASGYETPAIDRLAKEGMFFSHFYAAQPVCSASRAGLLTGCYPNRIGITGALFPNSKIGINPKEETIAELLKKKGYACGMVGKWHLGHLPPFLPLQNGFDEYLGLPYSNDMWPVDHTGKRKKKYRPLFLIEGNDATKEISTLDDQSELTTLYTERAVHFIEKHKDGKQPFFLYVAHSMPHIPLAVSPKFKGKSSQGMYGDVMMEIDWSVQQIMTALQKHGLEENTLVILTSDNGPWINFGNHAGSSGGLREAKGTSFEGGIRVPCIMKWKGVIPEGRTCNQLASTIDILPTLAEITQAPLPEQRIDGISILPLLKGQNDKSPRKHFVYYHNKNDLLAVRNERFKIVFPHTYKSYSGVLPGNDGQGGPRSKGEAERALYDLRRDPSERYNVIVQYPEVAEQLEAIANTWREELGDNLTGKPGKDRRKPGEQ